MNHLKELNIIAEPSTFGDPVPHNYYNMIREFKDGARLPQVLILYDTYPINKGIIKINFAFFK